MSSTLLALFQGYAGVLAFGLFFLPPGYLLASITNFNGFRERSRAEKLLWSLCFSLPLAIQLCVSLGRSLPRWAIFLLFAFVALAAFTRLWSDSRKGGRRLSAWKPVGATRVGVAAAFGLGFFFVAAATDVQIGPHLYVSSVLPDWSVRVPMVAAAMRSGVPPINGLCALGGQPAALRYFYFWYVVCADLARLFHLPAKAALAASCAWAASAVVAAFVLSLKYLLGIRRHLRGHCVAGLLVLAVIGLDLIPTLRLFLVKRLHPFPEIDWWHQDRTPSLLDAALFAPHHAAAFACLLTGLLVVALTLREDAHIADLRRWKQLAFAAMFAGACFASGAGCSILPALIVAILCLVWVVDLLGQRQFFTVAVLVGSAVTALLLASSFLHELGATTGSASGSLLSLHWRNLDVVRAFVQRSRLSHSAPVNFLVEQGIVLAVHLLDLGFFAFVLLHRIGRDWNRRLVPGERALWAFFLGTAIPYLFLSSASNASPNDLGVDAGFLLRLLLQIWAAPWIYQLWENLRTEHPKATSGRLQRVVFAMAAFCFVLGLAGQLFQIVWGRTYFPLIASRVVPKKLDSLTADRLSERLYNIQEAYQAFDALPGAGGAGAPIQYNPVSPMQPALTLYSTHQIAAFDPGCGTSYGGDYAACLALMPRLLALYGNTEAGVDRGITGNDRQDDAAPVIASGLDAIAVCKELHTAALIVESTDSIWSKRSSWVWTMNPAVSNATVRVFRCPHS